MEERGSHELELLRRRYETEWRKDGRWLRIASYRLPPGWNRSTTDVAFQIPVEYPGTPPYGIYVPAGLMFNGALPNNYNDSAPTRPPFGGAWGLFSWAPEGPWRATSDIVSGSNLLNWVIGFADRFRQGK